MTEYITFAVQAGGVEANDIVYPHYMKLRRFLAARCSRGYGRDMKEFAFVLRIDGSIGYWNKYGCDNLRVSAKSGIGTVDIFMPEDVWKGGDDHIISFLGAETRTGFRMMLERALKKNMDVHAKSLTADFEAALSDFQK